MTSEDRVRKYLDAKTELDATLLEVGKLASIIGPASTVRFRGK